LKKKEGGLNISPFILSFTLPNQRKSPIKTNHSQSLKTKHTIFLLIFFCDLRKKKEKKKSHNFRVRLFRCFVCCRVLILKIEPKKGTLNSLLSPNRKMPGALSDTKIRKNIYFEKLISLLHSYQVILNLFLFYFIISFRGDGAEWGDLGVFAGLYFLPFSFAISPLCVPLQADVFLLTKKFKNKYIKNLRKKKKKKKN
jgi:hypothetical protein